MVRVRRGCQVQAISIAVTGFISKGFDDLVSLAIDVLPVNCLELRPLAPLVMYAATLWQFMVHHTMVIVITKAFCGVYLMFRLPCPPHDLPFYHPAVFVIAT